jgi:hypothetical protein
VTGHWGEVTTTTRTGARGLCQQLEYKLNCPTSILQGRVSFLARAILNGLDYYHPFISPKTGFVNMAHYQAQRPFSYIYEPSGIMCACPVGNNSAWLKTPLICHSGKGEILHGCEVVSYIWILARRWRSNGAPGLKWTESQVYVDILCVMRTTLATVLSIDGQTYRLYNQLPYSSF